MNQCSRLRDSAPVAICRGSGPLAAEVVCAEAAPRSTLRSIVASNLRKVRGGRGRFVGRHRHDRFELAKRLQSNAILRGRPRAYKRRERLDSAESERFRS